MLWYRCGSDNDEDPIIYDLIDKFGGRGHHIFFAVLNLYTKKYKPDPDWHLDLPLKVLSEKTRRYKLKTLKVILKYIENYDYKKNGTGFFPEMKVKLHGYRFTVFISDFSRIMDFYTRKKVNELNKEESGPAPLSQPMTMQKHNEIFEKIAASLAMLKAKTGNNNINIPDERFVGKCIKEKHPIEAIADCYDVLDEQWESNYFHGIDDLFGYSLGIVKSTSQKYPNYCYNPAIWESYNYYFNGKKV